MTNDFRVVDGNTYYFDEFGYQITGTGKTKINGKWVLIVNGVIAEEGTMPKFDGYQYAIGANGEILSGWLDAKGKASTASGATYYASTAEDTFGQFATGLQTIDGKKYVFSTTDSKIARATNTKGEFENLEGYWVDSTAEVAFARLIPATISGVTGQYLVDENGALVTYDKTTAGKITINGVVYIVDQTDNTAKPDHTDHKWAFASMDWTAYNFSTQSGTVTAKFTCEVGKEEGTAPADVKVENKAVKGTETELGYSVFKFTATADKDPSEATVSKPATETVYKQFKGGAWMDATEADWKKAGGDVSEDGEAESEPEKSEVAGFNSYNLFYTDAVIPVEGLASDATLGGKAGGFFVNNGDGTVSVKKGASASEIKTAAKPANSLIELTDSEGAVFSYQLPVYYQKPSLKLTSTKATVNKSAYDKTTIHTTVTQKKSNGLYEPVEVDAESDPAEVTFAPGKNKANLTIANGDNSGELAITATAKTSGKIVVKKANWAEDVKLSYTVAESSKDVIEGSTKNVILNSTGTSDGEQEVTLTLNGGEDMTGVTATFPKANKWAQAGVEIENVDTSDGNKLTSNVSGK